MKKIIQFHEFGYGYMEESITLNFILGFYKKAQYLCHFFFIMLNFFFICISKCDTCSLVLNFIKETFHFLNEPNTKIYITFWWRSKHQRYSQSIYAILACHLIRRYSVPFWFGHFFIRNLYIFRFKRLWFF